MYLALQIKFDFLFFSQFRIAIAIQSIQQSTSVTPLRVSKPAILHIALLGFELETKTFQKRSTSITFVTFKY